MRIGHFSDVHLLSLKGSRWVDFLSKRWIGGLNLLTSRARHHRAEIFDAMVDDFNREQLDHLVATGDITNVALESEFDFARRKFDRIELGPEHVTVIPGNHDAYVDQGKEHFEAFFGSYYSADCGWDNSQHNSQHNGQWPTVRIRDNVAIIGLSTSLETPWFTCYGVLGEFQLARLESILSDPRLDGFFRLVAIHHPPCGERAQRKNRGLRDHAEFTAILGRVGAELVLHGHEHEDVEEMISGPAGPIAVRGIQSASYGASSYEHLARYRIYEVGSSRTMNSASRPTIVSESLRRWDARSESFVDDEMSRPLEPTHRAQSTEQIL